MKIKGKVVAVMPVKTGTSKVGNEWKSQDFVVEYYSDKENRYAKKICMNVFGAEKIDDWKLQVGMQMSFWFDIEAKEYNGRWFNSINCYKVSIHDNDNQEQAQQVQQPVQQTQQNYESQAYQQAQQLYQPNGQAPTFPQQQTNAGAGNDNGGLPF